MRLGPGPVFVYEWLTTTRRWQLYAMRALFVGAILAGLAFVLHQTMRYREPRETVSLAELAAFGQAIYSTIATVELTLVLLAAPAATAGAVCLDKARGTLDHMLATDLSNAEIVLGKLGVRLIPVLGLIVCVLPVVALSGLLGGIDPMALLGSFLVAIGCALVGCALAMTLSVWARKTHEVVMMTYILIVIWLIFPGLVAMVMWLLGSRRPPPFSAPVFWQVVIDTNPYYLVFAPYTDPSNVGLWTFLAFLGGCLATSGCLVGLSTMRIRRVALSQAGRAAAAPRRQRLPRLHRPIWLPRLPGPSLDSNPVAWREWHRMRPSWMMRIAWGLYAALGVFGCLLLLNQGRPLRFVGRQIATLSGFQVTLGLLLLSVSASTSLAEERARGSLDILLSTPMSTRSILAGKWWGTFRQIGPVLFWPELFSFWLLLDTARWIHFLLLIGTILGYGAVITSLGLALATWVSRLGRAVALCITAYVVFSIGWPILIGVLFKPDSLGRSLMMGCPAVGTLAVISLIGRDVFPYQYDEGTYTVAATLWTAFNLLAAANLFAATVMTFDRRLGRMPEKGGRPESTPRKESFADLIEDPGAVGSESLKLSS
jgi:ABC-type transport system involved in multi-copper enzyme maturation permease subunit